ncbi:MAG: aminotransferase class III-fold pyridoxal phosphate-dependent enzyme, partial [Acidobacteriota bacterium]
MPAASHRYPDSPLFYRRLNRAFPRAVRAEGCWIVDEDGKRYLDASGGAMVTSIGQGSEEIAAAIAEQAKTLAYVNGTQFTNAAAEDLAAELA